MSLMQISEPGESQAKAACKTRAVGIDLGTTNSLVAHVEDGTPAVIEEGGNPLLPSAVYYGPEVVVGAQALAVAAEHPRQVLSSVKRFMGRAREDVAEEARLVSYELAPGDGPVVRFQVAADRAVSPTEVSAEILRALKARAEAAMGGDVEGAVITVPAYFDDGQRQATKDAARLAGLTVLRLINEPTAAALAYGLDKGAHGTYAVYDLGGGTFDISILELVEGVFQVKSTAGNASLGGDDFDRAVAGHMADAMGIGDVTDHKLARRLLTEARRVKEELTETSAATFRVAAADGKVFERGITRDQLTAWLRPIVDRTAAACRQALGDAELDPGDLDGVILVGGATRTPVVREFVRELFHAEPLGDIDPDRVVALGAAVQADILAGGRRDDVLLLDVLPLSLGLETMGGVVEHVIARNSTIPAGSKQEFTTYADNQTGIDVHVVQGERDQVEHCRSLARFKLTGIPPMPAGMARVEIMFLVDADGLLIVTARELTTGHQTQVEVKPSYGLTDEEVERMLLESYEHADDDKAGRLLATERVEADRIAAATRAAMADAPDLLDEDVRTDMEAALTKLEELRDGQDHHAIHDQIEALDRAAKPFAEKRMNRAIDRAMRGKSVTEMQGGL